MRHSRLTSVLATALLASLLGVATASAAHDPCKVLTAEQFGKIMGYAAAIDRTGSNAMHCFYTGPQHAGGQFTILSEEARPNADAPRRGSAPPARSGLLGGAYQQGTVLFSLSIRTTDQAKVDALAAEVKRNLK